MLFANDLFLSDETTEKTAGEDSWIMQIGKSVRQKRKNAAAATDHNEGVWMQTSLRIYPKYQH